MKQLKTTEEILALLDLSKPIHVRSARQNGSTYTSRILADIIGDLTGRMVKLTDTVTMDDDYSTGVMSETNPLVELFVKTDSPYMVSAPNYVHSFLGDGVLSIVFHSLNGVSVAHWKCDKTAPDHEFDAQPLAEEPTEGLSPDFVAFKEAGVEFWVLDRVFGHLDLSKPITVIGRRPRQGASTVAGMLTMELCKRVGLPAHIFSPLSDPARVLSAKILREKGGAHPTLNVDPCHFVAGLETVQKAEFIMTSRLEKIDQGVVLIDELNPMFVIPGPAAANPVSADIFTSSAQIRFTTTLREQLAKQCEQPDVIGLVTGTSNAPGELMIATNTIVTYLNNGHLSILAVGEDRFSVCHMTVEIDQETDTLVIDPYNDGRVPSNTDISEFFSPDVDSVIRYFADLKAAKAFEQETVEISTKAEMEQNDKPDLSVGLR